MSDRGVAQRVEAVRRFNRFYTQKIGVLQEGLLESPLSLTEGRVLYELARREEPTATELGRELGLDAGYLSRILSRFEKKGLLRKKPSQADGRRSLLQLTKQGRAAFASLDARSSAEIATLVDRLSPAGQKHLVEAMHTIEGLLG
ncbi:MAG: MarR family winged helix-turn-helix transcriptional regulator, partial [Archangium sp.]